MPDAEMQALLETVRSEVEEIAGGSGYGRVVIDCAAGAPREIHPDRPLRFRRHVCPVLCCLTSQSQVLILDGWALVRAAELLAAYLLLTDDPELL